MHLPDPIPANHVETRFIEDANGPLMTLGVTLPERETRSQMLMSGMERGSEASARLEVIKPGGLDSSRAVPQ
jgi:hypothetical protein